MLRRGSPASSRLSPPTPRCRPCARCATAPAAPAACRRSCWVAGTTPAASRTSPAPAARQSHSAARHLRRHVVGLVLHPLAIIGPSRRQHLVAHALAVQEHLIGAQRRGIKPRRLHRRVHRETNAAAPSPSPESTDDRAARVSVPALCVQTHCRLPSRVVKALLLPALPPHEAPSSNPSRSQNVAVVPSAYSTTSVAIIGGASAVAIPLGLTT